MTIEDDILTDVMLNSKDEQIVSSLNATKIATKMIHGEKINKKIRNKKAIIAAKNKIWPPSKRILKIVASILIMIGLITLFNGANSGWKFIVYMFSMSTGMMIFLLMFIFQNEY